MERTGYMFDVPSQRVGARGAVEDAVEDGRGEERAVEEERDVAHGEKSGGVVGAGKRTGDTLRRRDRLCDHVNALLVLRVQRRTCCQGHSQIPLMTISPTRILSLPKDDSSFPQ